MTEPTDPLIQIKIRKARDAWREVHALGYNNRRKALAELISELETMTGQTTEQITALISRPEPRP